MTRRASVKVAVFCALGALAACAPNPNGLGVADFGGVTGRVIDGRTLQAIPSATVSIGGRTQQLNPASAGVFSIDQVPVGTQTLTVASPGYATANVSVTIVKGTDATQLQSPIALQPVLP